MRKLRILMAGPDLSVMGGIPSVVDCYYKSSLIDRHDIRYVATHVDGSKLAKAKQALAGLTSYTWSLIWFRPDLVHIHISQDASTFRKSLFVLVAKAFGKRLLLHSHASQFSKFYTKLPKVVQAYVLFILNRADLLLVVCEYWKREFERVVRPSVTIKVIFNPVLVSQRSPCGNNNSDAALRLLFLGRLGERKGVFDLLEALARLKTSSAASFCLYVGGDGDVEKFQEAVERKQLRAQVKYVGWVRDEDKLRLFEKANIYVLPSYSEGLPMSILEAMAHGLPIISTAICGIPEAVEDGANGYLLQPGDVKGLAECLDGLTKNEALRSAMSRRSYVIAQQKFAVESVVASLTRVYTELVEAAEAR